MARIQGNVIEDLQYTRGLDWSGSWGHVKASHQGWTVAQWCKVEAGSPWIECVRIRFLQLSDRAWSKHSPGQLSAGCINTF